MPVLSEYSDELTGLYNRRYLKAVFEPRIAEAMAHQIPFSVVIVDIDHFKEVNDIHGHATGDRVIAGFARFLSGELRASDTTVRYGGDEFICIMPRTLKADAEMIYRRIGEDCRQQTFEQLQVTMSAGIASFPEDGSDFEAIVNNADKALYEAKRSGRDRIAVRGAKKAELPIRAFIDRLAEKELLRSSLLAEKRALNILQVNGILGIGKTRLIREVLSMTRGRDVIWCDCISFSENVAYYPIRELIRYRIDRYGKSLLSSVPSSYRLELGKLLPETLDQPGQDYASLDLTTDRFRLYESIKKVFEIGERPKIVVVDNLQWVDGESIEVFKFLFRSLKESDMTFIFIYRSEEVNPMLNQFLAYLAREHQKVGVDLVPFRPSDINDALKAMLGDEPPAELIEYVMSKSGGVPFFIEEIARELLGAQNLFVENDQWVFRRPAKVVVPDTVADVIIQKCSTLGDEARLVLEIGCVLGRFDIPITREITGYNEGHIMGLLNDIIRLGIVRYQQNRYEFGEAVTRDAIYRNYLAGPRGIMLHRSVASAIEKINHDRLERFTEDLALHYCQAGDIQKGVIYAMKAGKEAHQKYANTNAVRYYGWAVDMLSGQTDGENRKLLADALHQRGSILHFIADHHSAMKDFNEALRIAESVNDSTMVAAIRSSMGTTCVALGKSSEAVRYHQAAVDFYEKSGDDKVLARALMLLGIAHYRGNLYEKARINLDRGMQLAQKAGDQIVVARCLMNLGNIYGDLGRPDDALTAYQEAALSLEGTLDWYGRVLEGGVLNNAAIVQYSRGEFKTALRNYEIALEIFRGTGKRDDECRVLQNIIDLYTDTGDFQKAHENAETALNVAKITGNEYDELFVMEDVCQIYCEEGEYGKARELCERMTDIGAKFEKAMTDILLHKCMMYIATDSLVEAKSNLDKIDESADLSRSERQRLLFTFAEFYLANSNMNKFQQTIERIRTEILVEGNERQQARIYLMMGRGSMLERKLGKAEEYFEKAASVFEKIDEKPKLAQVFYYWAGLAKQKGDFVLARDIIGRSLNIAISIKARGWEEKAARLKTELEKTR